MTIEQLDLCPGTSGRIFILLGVVTSKKRDDKDLRFKLRDVFQRHSVRRRSALARLNRLSGMCH
jgi:hypothetical protein